MDELRTGSEDSPTCYRNFGSADALLMMLDMSRVGMLGVVCVVVALCAGCSTSIMMQPPEPPAPAEPRGHVFSDLDGDGVRQDGEPGVAGVLVAVNRNRYVRTDNDGTFEIANLAPIVWARVPNGFRPGPAWVATTVPDAEIAIALVPLTDEELDAPMAFVVASDSHVTTAPGPWNGGDLRAAVEQAIDLPIRPRFFTIVGDITQGATKDDFARVDAALQGLPVPWVPVPGGHDWYDGGGEWRTRWGPDSYSFDVGNLHVVVWNTAMSKTDQLEFFANELTHVDPQMIVIALGHNSPSTDVGNALAALGVDYLFTGHWHANRRVERSGLVEWGTQNLVMGTIDQSPSGYRVVTFAGDVPIVEHRARLVSPHLALASPHAGSCTAPEDFDLLVSAAFTATLPKVTARVDCGEEIQLAARGIGGWSFGARIAALPPGPHRVDIRAATNRGQASQMRLGFEVCTRDGAAPKSADWSQPGGGPEHTGVSATAIVPPMQQVWATSVGGNVLLGTPIVAGGIVIVSLWDLGAGDGGGLVALDLVTGRERWRYSTKYQVRSAPAVDGETIVVALANGEVHALRLATGTRIWAHDAAAGLDSLASSLWNAPAISNGVAYVSAQGRITALDLASGEPRWSHETASADPWLGTLASVTVSDGIAIANYGRDDGMTAWDAATGVKLWEDRTSAATAINATPVAEDGVLYAINSSGRVTAYELATGVKRWTQVVTPGGSEWMYSVTAAPVVAKGRLFVPTQWRDLVALDAATGAELWRTPTAGGALNFTHYRAAEPGYAASPALTGEILWAPRPDGRLAALSPNDGSELWSTQLGAPVVSAPAPAGDYLIASTFDGTVRALVPTTAERRPAEPIGDCPPIVERDLEPSISPAPATGCCQAGDPSSAICALLVLGLLTRRRSRPRLRSSARGSASPQLRR